MRPGPTALAGPEPIFRQECRDHGPHCKADVQGQNRPGDQASGSVGGVCVVDGGSGCYRSGGLVGGDWKGLGLGYGYVVDGRLVGGGYVVNGRSMGGGVDDGSVDGDWKLLGGLMGSYVVDGWVDLGLGGGCVINGIHSSFSEITKGSQMPMAVAHLQFCFGN
nr:hypothetical protein CFP56_14578 [Quercus suber]